MEVLKWQGNVRAETGATAEETQMVWSRDEIWRRWRIENPMHLYIETDSRVKDLEETCTCQYEEFGNNRKYGQRVANSALYDDGDEITNAQRRHITWITLLRLCKLKSGFNYSAETKARILKAHSHSHSVSVRFSFLENRQLTTLFRNVWMAYSSQGYSVFKKAIHKITCFI